MTNLYRHRIAWTGFAGAPGVSTFYGLVAGAMMTPLHDLCTGLVNILPATVTLQVENSGDIIDSVTGNLTGTWTEAAVGPVTGLDTTVYSAPSGATLTWLTSTVADSHRLRGRTYLVPLGGDAYQADGTLASSVIDILAGVASGFEAASLGNLVVWHRPRVAAAATAYHPAVTARDGSFGLVTASSVKDAAAVLRSRRD